MMAKGKKEKARRTYRKPVPSTQQNIPIRDVYNGVAITAGKKFVKLVEVKPQPFFLKKIGEQNHISDFFANLLKTGPDELHIKSMSLPSDLSYQIAEIERCMESEKDEECRKMGGEYIQRLKEAQSYGISRRFFMSFPYTGRQGGLKSVNIDEIVRSLDNDEYRLRSSLAECGNETISEYPQDPNMDILKTLYMVYNRDSYLIEPFENRVQEINSRYLEKMKDQYFYIPIQDYIAPSRISYDSNRYLVINNTYYSFLYIPSDGYNPVAYTGWLNKFVTSYPGVDVDVFLKRIPKDQVINGIRRSIGHARLAASENLDTSESYEESLNTLGSAQYLKNGLSMGNDFYNMSIIITVSGTSPEQVSYYVNELKQDAREDDIVLKENINRAEETFNMVLPTSSWDDSIYTFKKTKRNLLTEGAASLYPFTTFQLVDRDGLYIADDRNGSPVVLDQFSRKRINNPHMFIAGETGAGKTTTLMLIALRARVKNLPVYIIAPEKQDEYKRLTAAIGGQFVDIGAGSPDRINIMEIFPVDESSRDKMAYIDGDEGIAESYLIRKVSSLSDFFALHIPTISSTERFDLEEAIISTYQKKGITSSNESLWADEKHTHYKKMPIISDLVNELEAKPDTVRLAKTIKLLTKGNGEHFDGQTNVDINNNFVVVGLQHNSEDMLGLSIFMAMDFITSKCMENRIRNKYFIIDEAWKLLMNPIAANRLMASIRLLRAFSTSTCIATQNLTDVLAYEDGKFGLAVLNNCATKLFMTMKEKDARIVQDMIDISESEVSNVTRFKAGQALLIAGETRIYLMMTPTETEKLLTFTDKETLEKYVNLKKKREEEERLQELYQDAIELDDLFDYSE